MQLNDLVAKVEIVDSASAVAARVTSAMNDMAAAEAKVGDATDTVNTKISGSTRSLQTAASQFENLKRSVDPVYDSMTRLANQQLTLQKAVDLGVATQTEANAVYATLKTRAEEGAVGIGALGAAHGALSAQGQTALHTLRDLATQLPLGVPPAMVLTQQLGHLTFAAAGPGGLTGAFTEAIGTLGRFVTPVTVAAAATAVLAGGVFLVLQRVDANREALRTFNLALGDTSGGTSAAALSMQAGAKALENMGVAAADANKAMADLARNPMINPAAAGDIARIGANVGAALGVSPDQGVKALTDALSGGVDAITKFGLSIHAMSTDEAASITIMAQHGQGVAALNRALGDIDKTTEDYRSHLSDTVTNIESLTTAWNHTLDALANTGPFQALHNELVQLADDLTKAFSGASISPTSPLLMLLGLLPGGGALASYLMTPSSPPLSPTPPTTGFIGTPPGGMHITSPTGIEFSGLQLGGALTSIGPTGVTLTSNLGPGSPPIGTTIPTITDADRAFSAQFSQPKIALAGVAGMPQSVASISGGAVPALVQDPDDVKKAQAALDDYNTTLKQQLQIDAAVGPQQQALTSYYGAFNTEMAKSHDVFLAMDAGNAAMNGSLAETGVQFQKETDLANKANQGLLGVAGAYVQSEAAGLKAQAAEQARIDTINKGGDATARYQTILESWAAAAIDSAGKALPGLRLQADATQNLADAAAKGAGAEHEAQLQNQVTAATHDALTKAIQTGNPALIAEAQNVTAATAALIKKNDAAQTALQLNQQASANDNQAQVAQLEASLQGQTTDQISQQVALLQAKQFLQSKNVDLASDEGQKYLANVTALGQANIALAQSRTEWGLVNGAVESVGQNVDQQLTQNLENAFDGQKLTSWGTVLHQILAQAEAQIVSLALIKPAIGSALGLLGLPSASSNFGSFGKVAA
jgi:hypothetical protein